MTKPEHDVAALKEAARGQWAGILAALGGVAADLLDGEHHPCPRCGGTDRFRFTNLGGDGSVYCHQCNHDCGDGIAALQWLRDWSFPEVVNALGEHLGRWSRPAGNGKPRITATYDYKDESGKLLYQVVRFDPKDFRQRRPKAGGGWIWNVKGVRLVPYRLPELLAADASRTVLIPEGEKDVDRAASMGIIATCNVGGAGKWRPEYAEHFRGRIVVIIADNDEAGRKHAQQVAVSLYGVAKLVKVVLLPGVPEKGDLSDWLDQGRTKAELGELVKAAPEWKPAPADKQPQRAKIPKKKPEPPPFVSFPTDVLPHVVAEFTHRAAAALLCDESYIAVPLLAVLSGAVGNSRRIRMKHGWCEPCMVWAVVVGVSGTVKSPAFDATIEPFARIQDEAITQYDDAMEQYARDLEIYDTDLTAWKKTGRKNGEPPPEKPEEPVCRRYMAEDTTAEAVLLLLQDQPRGLLVARDELSGWINSFDAYKTCRGTDAALWLSMHRGRQVIKDRVGHKDRKTGRRRVIHVPRAAVSITGTIQPKTLAAALVGRYQAGGIDEAMDKPGKEHFDNGLAARLLFTMPPRTPKKWTDDELLPEDVRPMTELVDRLLALDMPVDEKGRPQPRDIPLSARAKREWVRFFTEHNEEIVTLSGDLAAAWSKLEGYTARFALLVHLVRSVTGDTMVDPGAVDEQSIAAGVKLSKWFGDEAARVYAIIGGDTETPEACEERELIRIMRDHDGEITVRGLMQASRHYRSSAEEAEASLGRLVAANKATVWVNNRTKGGGRPVPVYTLIDSGDGNTTGEIPAKNGVVVPLPPDEETKLQLPPDESATDLPPRW